MNKHPQDIAWGDDRDLCILSRHCALVSSSTGINCLAQMQDGVDRKKIYKLLINNLSVQS